MIENGKLTGYHKWYIHHKPQKASGPMAIGTILKEPHDLKSSLNEGSAAKLESLDEESTSKQVILAMMEVIKTGGSRLEQAMGRNVSMFARKLMRNHLSVNWKEIPNIDDESRTRVCAYLSASILGVAASAMAEVDKKFINERLLARDVVQFVKETKWTGPLYMIVGVGSFKLPRSENESSSTEPRASLSTPRDPVINSESEDWKEYDFAYRIRRLHYMENQDSDHKDNQLQGTITTASAQGVDRIPVFKGFCDDDEDIGGLTLLAKEEYGFEDHGALAWLHEKKEEWMGLQEDNERDMERVTFSISSNGFTSYIRDLIYSSHSWRDDRRWYIYDKPQKAEGPMSLGAILTKPDELTTALNLGSQPPITNNTLALIEVHNGMNKPHDMRTTQLDYFFGRFCPSQTTSLRGWREMTSSRGSQQGL
ncbi:hypothetical protein F5Y16DRAFT_423154 [Xylariaceae sp. FL0255]|nr:hypothetical protein F5Y16DRAFT_423154 [Xylariaceae sp. FL0255]